MNDVGNLYRQLDDALAGRTRARVGAANLIAVRCAACGIDCEPGQARAVYLAVRLWRRLWLCLAHAKGLMP